MERAVSDIAWVQAMLDVEAGIARAEARLGLIPAEAAERIAARCRAEGFDIEQLGRDAVPVGNPVIPLVRALTESVPEDAAAYVHWGATSQDVLDTATALVARGALGLLADDLEAVAAACAGLAVRHRGTLMPGRTLLQHALPITFGLKAAGWLTAVLEALDSLVRFRSLRLAAQFGGAAGTLAAVGPRGLEVLRELSAGLGLAEPTLPWHTHRGRIAELGAVLGLVAGTVGKIALDVALMTQTEVAEVSEPGGPGRGGSSTMPQKRNPVAATEVSACVRGVNAQVGLLLGAMVQEHERAAGAWQAEWRAVGEALALTGGAVARTREALEGLEVHEGRMRANVDLTGGLLLSEQVMMALAERIGRPKAHELVRAAVERAARRGRGLLEELVADPAVGAHLSRREVEATLDPSTYLGSSDALVDRALAAYELHRRRADER
jgi:3-carboxy-cis,cis-muconate cycloisomerase